MGSYENFARVYDELMDNVPYEEWAQFILNLLQDRKITEGLVLELGCGTGKLMTLLGKAGFDMIGVDNSVEMLQIAREKTSQDFLYLLQDMREFELYGTVKAVISVCDSVNYITKKEELRKVFQLVNNYLDPEGVFIFDFNTEYKYRELNKKFIRRKCSDFLEAYEEYTMQAPQPDSGRIVVVAQEHGKNRRN